MDVRKQVCAVIEDVLAAEKPHFNPVKLLAVGCSSSEIVGGSIGHDSTYQVGEEVAQAILDKAAEHGFDAAFQCCEHLNRALVMERAAAAYRRMRDPVVVEKVSADAGVDIGRTLVGMHLRAVAVPVRPEHDRVGEAIVIAARTRPRLIGGERAKYE